MTRKHQIRIWIYRSLAALGLVTALVLNGISSMQGANYLEAWFGQPVDWVLSVDLLIVALAVVTLMLTEARRLKIPRVWLYFLFSGVTAMAFTFPLFMAAREKRLLDLQLAGGKLETFDFDGHKVEVWIPQGKDAVKSSTPVLVMHDGKNVFDPATSSHGTTWGVLDAVRAGELRGELPIVVAVSGLGAQTRMRELAPEAIMRKRPEFWQSLDPEALPTGTEPLGDAYLSLVTDAILPFVAERYGLELASERVAVMGSSMGGLMSLYFMAQRPEIYGTAICFSTHWTLGGEDMVRQLVGGLPAANNHRVWTDAGEIDIDANYRSSHLLAHQLLESAGYQRPESLAGGIVAHTGHSESYWSRRVADALNWWLRS